MSSSHSLSLLSSRKRRAFTAMLSGAVFFLLVVSEGRAEPTTLPNHHSGEHVTGRRSRGKVSISQRSRCSTRTDKGGHDEASIEGTAAKNTIREALRRPTHTQRRSTGGGDGDDQAILRATVTGDSPLSVSAILVPRRFPLRRSIQWVCWACLLASLLECVKTAGMPHVRAIWGILHENAAMPEGYLPSPADLHLSQILAAATEELLPPIGLPSSGPLLGFMASLLVYVGAFLLLPRWSTATRVFLDYHRIGCGTDSPDTAKEILQRGRDDPSFVDGLSVLVKIHERQLQEEVAAAAVQGRSSNQRKHSAVVVPLCWSSSGSSDETPKHQHKQTIPCFSHLADNYFDLNQCRYYYNATTGSCSNGGPFLLQSASFVDLQGLVRTELTDSERCTAVARYQPYNHPSLATPTIREALLARLSSPLVVVQVLGRLLSCLEEGMRSLVSFVSVLGQHYYDAKQSILSARQMAEEVQTNVQDTSSLRVLVLRPHQVNKMGKPTKKKKKKGGQRKWVEATAGELIPGDIFCLIHDKNEESGGLVIPVDALLLDGQSLANEAVLTGESVPQSKIPIDFAEWIGEDPDSSLDLEEHRSSILFAGTTLAHCASQANQTMVQGVRVPAHHQSSGVVCMALRTGTYSSKGQLLRTLKNNAHIGAISNAQTEKDALRLIAALSVFATASCISLFVPRASSSIDTKSAVPLFRRIIQCTRIIIASIPSDLPLALSAVARTCSRRLKEEADVTCSEPGSLLTAAYIDTVLFDKTGTLTADAQSVSKIVSKLGGGGREENNGVRESFQLFQMAGCHSLIHLVPQNDERGDSSGQIVGDPLEQASLTHSGWIYNATEGCYFSPTDVTARDGFSAHPSDPIKFWQIKSFPFDPTKRLSSSIVLSQTADGSYRIMSLTKGSPEVIQELCKDSTEADLYQKKMQKLEGQGWRCIALAWKDITDEPVIQDLFPKGLNRDGVEGARVSGSSLHRNNFESRGLIFGGFVCFDAAIRPSSKRIVKELAQGGVKSVMLTGDAMDAAIIVASKVGILKCPKVAILEATRNFEDGSPSLHWRFIKLKKGKGGERTIGSISSMEIESFSTKSLKKVLKREQLGKFSIAATGSALEEILQNEDEKMASLASKLSNVSVIARATPKLKHKVVSTLRDRCNQRVMMIGDGVNDVAAIKAADVALALLNGFGDEKDSKRGKDADDERRKKKLLSIALGSNRRKKQSERNTEAQAARERMNKRIEKAQAEIKQRAAKRASNDSSSENVQFDLNDIKDMISATIGAVKSEREREKSLKKGGGDAARILNEERRKDTDGNPSTTTIKPGEASLVASFSSLHPSINGVDAVLRSGVATAACALATQQLIALNSLMSCFHLATLYRDGFRYAKNMWPVEMFMYMLVETARYNPSCIPRPRLPGSLDARPPESMFHPSSIISTVAQALVHLISMTVGVNYARSLETKCEGSQSQKSLIQLSAIPRPERLTKLLSVLCDSDSKITRDESDGPQMSFFRRPPFRPNYETNIVFIFSVLQNTVSCLVNHKGSPFYRSIWESRKLCFAFTLTAIGTVVLVGEALPFANRLLELKPFPSQSSKIIILGIAAANVLASFACPLMGNLFSGQMNLRQFASMASSKAKDNNKKKNKKGERELAADLEEKLLQEESIENIRATAIALAGLIYLTLEILWKPPKQQPS